jgi:hypothetical protein
MARDLKTRPSSWQRQILDERIRDKGLQSGEYAYFFVTREGITWPLPTAQPKQFEETSGYVVDRCGRVFAFWLGWDEASRAPALTGWDEVTPEPTWVNEPEYTTARRAVGLPAA